MSNQSPESSLWKRLTQRRHERRFSAVSQPSTLQFEALEERTLLSVTMAEYASLQAEYTLAALPESPDSLRLIELTELTDASLREALATAEATTCDDLIVVRTTVGLDQIDLTEALSIRLNTQESGSLGIVALGDVSLKLRGQDLVLAAESGDVFLGGVTLVGTGNASALTSPKELLYVGNGANVEMQSVLFAVENWGWATGTTTLAGFGVDSETSTTGIGAAGETSGETGTAASVGVTGETSTAESVLQADSMLRNAQLTGLVTSTQSANTGETNPNSAFFASADETNRTSWEAGTGNSGIGTGTDTDANSNPESALLSSVESTPTYYTLETSLGNGQWMYLTGVSSSQARALEASSYRYVQDGWVDVDKADPYVGGVDCNLCWAAQAANMLVYSGWGSAYSTSADAIYRLYSSRFTNSGGDAEYALEWFFTGSYKAPMTSGWARLKNNTAFSGYYSTSDFKSAYSNTTSESSRVNASQFATMANRLRNGYAVGVDIFGYDSSGHAMSVYGFVYDTTYSASSPNYYSKLILADSNDEKDALITCDLEWTTSRGVSFYDLDYSGFSSGCYVGAFHYLAPNPTPTQYKLDSVTLSTNTPQVGVSLTATVSPTTANVSYQWYSGRNSSSMTAISGATSAKFTPTADLAGSYLKCVVTGQGDYAGQSVSAVTGSVVVGSGDVVDTDSSLSATNITRYGSVTATLYVQNTGNAATTYQIQFYASKNANITASDYKLESCTVTVPAQSTQKVQQQLTFGDSIPEGTYYIGWMITATGTGITGYCETPLTVTLKGHGELATPTLSVVARGTSAINVTVGAVANATQYVIQYSTKPFSSSAASEIQTVRSYSAGTTTIKELTADTTYWVRAYAIDANNGLGSQYATTTVTTLDAAHSSDLVTKNTGLLGSTLVSPGGKLTISGIQIANVGQSVSDEYTVLFYATRNANAIGPNVAGCVLLDTITMDALEAGATAQLSASISTNGLSRDTTYFLGWVIESTSDINPSGHVACCPTKFMVSTKANQAVLTTEVNGTKIGLSWNAASKDGLYEVRYRTVGSSTWTTRTTNAMSYTITGQAGASYEIAVTVSNPEIVSAVNYSLTMGTFVTLPTAPRAGKATTTDDTGSVLISNFASSNLKDAASRVVVTITKVGSTATNYRAVLELNDAFGTGEFSGCGVTAVFEDGLLTLNGLNSNTSYSVEVAFECLQSGGFYVTSSAVKATLKTTKTAFTNVENVAVTARTESTLTVTWDPAAAKDNDALYADCYTVQYRKVGTERWTNAGNRIAHSEEGYTIQRLAADTDYEVRVLASATTQYNASSDGDTAAAKTLIKLETARLARDTVADDTVTVKVSNYSQLQSANQLTVTLTLVGKTKTNLTATLALTEGLSAEAVEIADTCISCSFANGVLTFNGLSSSTAYAVKVGFSTVSEGKKTAVSADSSEFRFTTTKAAYTTPQNLQVVAVEANSVQLTWSVSVGKNTTKQAQYYTVQYLRNGRWTTAVTRVSGTSCTVSRLAAGVYSFRICAVGTSEFNASDYGEPLEVTVG